MSESVCQQDLANVIKGTHADLRLKVLKNSEKCGNSENGKTEDDVWAEHVEAVMLSTQKSYAKAMNDLAKRVWECKDPSVNDTTQSRIEWIRRHLVNYFFENDQQRFEEKLDRKLNFLLDQQMEKRETDSFNLTERKGGSEGSGSDKISILDVGSCYNPFSKFPNFEVIAIDLSPSPDSDVHQCDFVTVNLSEKVDKNARIVFDQNCQIKSIYCESFDAVIFCLLLEYLPSSRSRYYKHF